MSSRKEYIRVMNKYVELYEQKSRVKDIEPAEIKIIKELIGYGYFDRNAFATLESDNVPDVMLYKGNNPLTLEGKEYLELGWYLRFKESGKYQFIRDLFAIIGGTAGIIAVGLKIYSFLNH